MLLSLRAYARHRGETGLPGKTLRAVQKAVLEGRIQRTPEGLIDAELADQAWAENTGLQKARPPTTPPAPPGGAAVADPADPRHPTPPGTKPKSVRLDPDDPADPALDFEAASSAHPGMGLAEASALEKVWRANLAELEFKEKLGELVGAKDLDQRIGDLFSSCKTKLLGIPARVRQVAPHIAQADLALFDRFLREALEGLALDADGEDDDDAA